MATFKVKTFNELSGKGQNGDIAIIERADINGNKGFTFRDASGWSLPFVQVETLGANLMTTNTSQSVNAAKTFQGEVAVNDDFSVIGATDIDLGFTGILTVDGDGGDVQINDLAKLSLSEVDQVRINDPSIITFENDDEGDSKARIWVNKYPTNHLGAATNLDGAFGLYFRRAWYIPAQYEYVGLQINNSKLELASTKSGATLFNPLSFGGDALTLKSVSNGGSATSIEFRDGSNGDVTITDARATKQGIEYAADYSASLKVNARSLIDAGTMSVMLEDYIAASPTYADNAAALVGGLAVGKMYKTATGELRIVV